MRAPGAEHPCRDADEAFDPLVTINDLVSTESYELEALEGFQEWVRLVAARADAEMCAYRRRVAFP